jgi:hypothetical protein
MTTDERIKQLEMLLEMERAKRLARPYVEHMQKLSDPAYIDRLARRYRVRLHAVAYDRLIGRPA